MEVNSFFSEVNNIKNFDVIIVDAYSYNAIIYIPEHESLDPFFFTAAVKGKPSTFLILTGKN
jgi:hypothetical protein